MLMDPIGFMEQTVIFTRTCITWLILWWKHDFICELHLQRVEYMSYNIPS